MSEALRTVIDQLGAVNGPVSGLTPSQAAPPVGEVDLDHPLGSTAAAVEEVTRLWMRDAVWFHEPRYAAHLNCPIVIPALAAEVLLTAVNSSLDTFDQSVGGTFIERHLIDWTAARIGFEGAHAAGDGPVADGVFTSGGSQSNLQALVCARGRAERRGVTADRMRILASGDGHFSVQKSARLMGLPDAAVVPVPVDHDRRMDVVELGRLLQRLHEQGEVPIAVVATAGTTDFGAIDDLRSIGALCRAAETWCHVDAAYGGGLLTSARHRHRLAGIELADSVTVDYHKTFFQPVSSSAVLVRDRDDLAAVSWHADYLNPADSDRPNQVDKSLQTTRRFDALKLWLTLRTMGADTIGEYLDAVIALTGQLHEAVRDLADVEVAAPPQLSTLVFRYAPPGLGEEATGELNRRIRSVLFHRGSAVVAATRVDGRQFLKMTLLNPKATFDDLIGIIDEVRVVGEDLHSRDGNAVGVGGAR
ncbi:aspartate aminotransferase family protein [Nocardioides panacisoli]|uniref:pyridoxal phosphate-dependent decarboxylase family protein n=1 Tax=Nocardioides panacisoli TaxID=627624 RepID=UPI001C625EE1|nr:aspartate aminotransferase family protein [Nocardioides panacisoli]QYJ05110.1 aspartate aminotransferase family protein [Nocardioides panacisoli]